MIAPLAPIDVNYLHSRRIFCSQSSNLHLIQVGCGGIGAQLAPSTARIARECTHLFQDVQVSFYDGDKVEEKNIRRQQFCYAEIGRNKAESLAYRLNTAWGLQIEAYPFHFHDNLSGVHYSPDTVTILIGCVDNHRARRTLHKYIAAREHSEPIWWLDGGCYQTHAQVLLGNTVTANRLREGFTLPTVCTALPTPGWLHPELLKPRQDEKKRPSCADLAQEDPQSLTINMVVAAHMADYLLRLLITKDLTRFATYIDMNSGSTRSLYATPQQVAQSLPDITI
jgi:PRTRC genetic system ThiF family protein